jgi:hypothetical protein
MRQSTSKGLTNWRDLGEADDEHAGMLRIAQSVGHGLFVAWSQPWGVFQPFTSLTRAD